MMDRSTEETGMKQKQGSAIYLTPAEVAEMLLVAPVTVRQWAQKGWLHAEMTGGGHRRFLWREVERFAHERGIRLHTRPGGDLRLLIVDDDRQLVRYLTELLVDRSGLEVVESAHDGFEAGMKVRSFNPDVILLDLMMPRLDGFTVCRQLRSDPVTRAVRIIAMTGFHTPENEARILQAGAEVCLAKPFDRDRLFALLGLDGKGAAGAEVKIRGHAAADKGLKR
jgi:excisionase family DNA binding protein